MSGVFKKAKKRKQKIRKEKKWLIGREKKINLVVDDFSPSPPPHFGSYLNYVASLPKGLESPLQGATRPISSCILPSLTFSLSTFFLTFSNPPPL